jgi:hypothetical protein
LSSDIKGQEASSRNPSNEKRQKRMLKTSQAFLTAREAYSLRQAQTYIGLPIKTILKQPSSKIG